MKDERHKALNRRMERSGRGEGGGRERERGRGKGKTERRKVRMVSEMEGRKEGRDKGSKETRKYGSTEARKQGSREQGREERRRKGKMRREMERKEGGWEGKDGLKRERKMGTSFPFFPFLSFPFQAVNLLPSSLHLPSFLPSFSSSSFPSFLHLPYFSR